MSVTFYNERGSMFGVDLHTPEETGKVPTPLKVEIRFDHPAFLPQSKKVGNVTMDGAPAFQGGIDFYLIPHWLFPAGVVGTATANSGSKGYMQVHAVTLGGEPAATCQLLCMGRNVNCSDPVDHPLTNVVMNPNSVVTSPTLGDYAGSWVGMVLDSLISAAVGAIAGEAAPRYEMPLKHTWRRAADMAKEATKNMSQTTQDAVNEVFDKPGKVSKSVQEQVDSALR